jgi:recombination protein RecR
MNNLDYPLPVLELVTALKQLPGIGTRGAERMALWMLQGHMGEAEAIARTIGQAAEHVTPCPVCGFFSTAGEPCSACRDEERDSRLICVVEQATDVIPIERSSAYRGLYHCLGGKLSPLDDVEPEDLNIQSLVERVTRLPGCEVILATGSDVEGEATATYLHHLLKELDCKISRPAQGLPAGAGLSHADTLTLMKALEGRTAL